MIFWTKNSKSLILMAKKKSASIHNVTTKSNKFFVYIKTRFGLAFRGQILIIKLF